MIDLDQLLQQQRATTTHQSISTNSTYMYQMGNPMKVSMTATATMPTIFILIVIIVSILVIRYVLIVVFYENGFDCGSEFGERLSLVLPPKIVNGQLLTHTISFNFNRMGRIGALYEFGIALLSQANRHLEKKLSLQPRCTFAFYGLT